MARQSDQRRAATLELLESLKSTGLWSVIGAVVGVIATLAGIIVFLTIDELRNFAISVLIIGLVLLFIALVLSPRALAMFMAGRQGRYGANVAVMTVAFFAIMILLNFLMFRTPQRIDVTATRVFTLSQQAVKVLESLPGPVRANAFYVPNDSNTAIARQQAEDLLNEFDRRSNNFTYRFIDPELNRSVAVQYDVRDFPVIVIEDIDTDVHQAVSGLTEQDLITGILVATATDQKRVYYLTGHQEAGITRDLGSGETDNEGFDFAIQGMQRDNYYVLPLNLAQMETIPEDAAVVVVPGPKRDLTQDELDAFVSYLVSGGRVVMLLDPDTPDSYRELLARWGLLLQTNRVADLISNVGEATTPQIQKSNAQLGTSGLTGGIPIADQIDVVFFADATAVLPVLPPTDMLSLLIEHNSLAWTTPASWLESHPEEVEFNQGDDINGPFDVAAVIEAGASLAGDLVDSGDEADTSGDPRAKLVVFGDSDFARNKFFFLSDNGDLLLNSVNWLAEDYELISIRRNLPTYRQLVLNSRERDFIKWTSWFLPPTIMLLIGVVVWWRRR